MKINKGSSLIEVLLALSVMLLVILALLRVVISSVKSNDSSKQKAVAATYSQEGIEYLRAMRDAGWSSFLLKSPSTGSVYRLGALPATPSLGDLVALPCDETTSANIDSLYTRCVTLKEVELNKIQANVIVYWKDSIGVHNSEVISYLTKWKVNE